MKYSKQKNLMSKKVKILVLHLDSCVLIQFFNKSQKNII